MKKPILIPNPDLTDLKDVLQNYMDYFENYDEIGHEDATEDYEYPILHECLMAFFGRDYYKYTNSKIE